ncbi:MAG: FtsH protease modulator HflK [Pseudomonadota bacterium]|jgi:membrane protease subunit HflK
MIHRLFRLFSIGDPRWGRQSDQNEPRQPEGDQPPRNEPPRNEPPRQRPGSEPPDLDEVWRDFNRKLGGLFGGKGQRGRGGRNPWGNGGGNGNGSGPGAGLPQFQVGKGLIGIIILALFGLYLASGFYIVQEGQTAVVLRFGQYTYASGAGFKWRMPYPFESHEVVNLAQLRQATVGFRGERGGQSRDSLMLTKDENMIDIQFAIQYRVSKPEDYLFNNVRPDEIVTQAAETAMREVVGRSLSDAVLYENKEAIGREALAITQRIADRYAAGLTIVNVTIQNVQPPEEVQAAFSDAIKAAQDAERLKNEGQAYANDVVPRARGAAERLIEEAEGYRERIVAQASGDADRFKRIVVEYAKAPQVTRERLYIETMQEVFTNVSKVMVENKSNSNLLYLPLDKIMQQTQAASQAAATAAVQGGPATPAPATAESAPAPQPAPAPSLRDRFREGR